MQIAESNVNSSAGCHRSCYSSSICYIYINTYIHIYASVAAAALRSHPSMLSVNDASSGQRGICKRICKEYFSVIHKAREYRRCMLLCSICWWRAQGEKCLFSFPHRTLNFSTNIFLHSSPPKNGCLRLCRMVGDRQNTKVLSITLSHGRRSPY